MVTNVISCAIQLPINPYGKAKKMAEDIILDFSKRSNMAVMILRSVADGNNFEYEIFWSMGLISFSTLIDISMSSVQIQRED